MAQELLAADETSSLVEYVIILFLYIKSDKKTEKEQHLSLSPNSPAVGKLGVAIEYTLFCQD